MKQILQLLIVICAFCGCKKSDSEQPLCNWFPLLKSSPPLYSMTMIGNNTPSQYVTKDQKTIANDSSFFFGSYKFQLNNCYYKQILLTYSNISGLLLFDGTKTNQQNTQVICNIYSNGKYYSVSQYVDAVSQLHSIVRDETDYYNILEVTFTPMKGVSYIREIRQNGGTWNIYTLK